MNKVEALKTALLSPELNAYMLQMPEQLLDDVDRFAGYMERNKR